MTLKDTIASCLVIALGVILALHFVFFWLYGGVFIHESNKVILSIETAMSVVIFSFGIERLLSSASKRLKLGASAISHGNMQGKISTAYTTSPSDLQIVRKAAIPNDTMAITILPKTTLLTDSDARYTENCTFKMSNNSTEDSGHVFIHTPRTEHAHSVHTEAT